MVPALAREVVKHQGGQELLTAKLAINVAEQLETLNKCGALADHEVFLDGQLSF